METFRGGKIMLNINTITIERVFNYPVYTVEKTTRSLLVWSDELTYTEIKTNGRSSVGVCTRGSELKIYSNLYILNEGESVTLTQE